MNEFIAGQGRTPADCGSDFEDLGPKIELVDSEDEDKYRK